jgi:hypothetical protein
MSRVRELSAGAAGRKCTTGALAPRGGVLVGLAGAQALNGSAALGAHHAAGDRTPLAGEPGLLVAARVSEDTAG